MKRAIPVLLVMILTAAPSYLGASDKAAGDGMEIQALDQVPALHELEGAEISTGDNHWLNRDLAMAEPEDSADKETAERRARHEQKISMFRLWRIIEEVDLTDEQVDKVFPLMREMQKEERELTHKRHSLFRNLRKELKEEKPAEAVIQSLVTQIEENDNLIWHAKKDAEKEIMNLLTVPQKARFLLAMNDVERDIWGAIARIKGPVPPLPEGVPFDREKFQEQMQKVRENLEKMKQDLQGKGLNMPDVDYDKITEDATKAYEEAAKPGDKAKGKETPKKKP